MSNIEFKDDSVCFADGSQWLKNNESNNLQYQLSNENLDSSASFDYVIGCRDFQLNTIKHGDYIEASELDTEQKYNDAVEVFGMFGFENDTDLNNMINFGGLLVDLPNSFCSSVNDCHDIKRRITFNQLMAIGDLKRLEIKRDKEPQLGKNEDGSMKLIKSNFSEKHNGCKDGGKYHREIIGLDGTKTTVDVYRILDAFKTDCAATDHAVKKMLCAGLRGHKDKITDYDNAIESLQAAKELLIQKSNNENTN